MRAVTNIVAFCAGIGTAIAVSCAVIPQTDGTAISTPVSCNATSPAKSVACAAATLEALSDAATASLKAGRLSNEQVQRLQSRFEIAYGYILRAQTALEIGDGNSEDYLGLAEDLLLAIEKELKQ